MTTFTHYCQGCRSVLRLKIDLAGRTHPCPTCRRVLALPNRKTIEEETIDRSFCSRPPELAGRPR